jgi:hypothetical protein
VYVIRCEDVMVKNRVPPQQMHTPYLILLCPEPKKKIPMIAKMGDWRRAIKRGVGYEGRMG